MSRRADGMREFPHKFPSSGPAFATGRTVEAYAYGAERKLTGKERDSESGLDNFGARYDASSLGRLSFFLSKNLSDNSC